MHQINYIKLPNYQSKKGSKTIFVFWWSTYFYKN